jgi:exonuclease SbcC
VDQRVRLISLDVEGFRGANKRVHLDFGQNATVLSAWNGQGKSTLLGAIEWALWGELRFQASENHAHDELNSMFNSAGRASVQLSLSQGGQEIRISREKTVRKKDSPVEVKDGTGKTLVDEEAQSYIFRLTGLTFDDFYRAAFLHQESIRGLLTEEQKDRDEALDRLFGVEKIRDLLTAIRLKPVTNALEEIEVSEGKLMARLAGAGSVAELVRNRAHEEALEFGYSEGDLTLDHGEGEARSLQTDLAKACVKYGQEPQAVIQVEGFEDLERVTRRVKTTVNEIRLAVGKESPLDAALGRLSRVRKLRAEIQAGIDAEKAAKSQLEEHDKDHGKPEDWAKEAEGLNERVRNVEAALHVLDVHGRVIADAIAYLETVPTARECPVCGDPKEAAKLATLLRTKVGKDQATKVRRLNKESEQAKERLAVIGDFQKSRLRLVASLEEASRQLKEARILAWQTLDKKGEAGDVLAELSTQETDLDGKLEGLRDLNKTREVDLKKLVDGADRLKALQRFLKADQDFERVREKSVAGESGGTRALENDKAQLLALKADLDAIIVALNGLATGRAEDALARCGEDIAQTYARLCNHPYFDGLKIEVGQKQIQGVQRNTYRIIAYSTKDGQRTSASSRLSTAQMNCVALSAYLSLSKVLNHNLGFMLLDDPSQNLDGEHKGALASILKDLLPSLQLVIGTHDAEFDTLLRNRLVKDGVFWYDLSWTPRGGTSLKPVGAAA